MWFTMRIIQAVNAEYPVIGVIIKIAAISVESPAVFTTLRQNTMVNPLPDTAAQKRFLVFNQFPVFLEIARAVSHRVRVLTHQERPVRDPGPFRDGKLLVIDIGWLELITLAFLSRQIDRDRIHRAEDINLRSPVRFTIVNQAVWIQFPCAFDHSDMVAAVS